MVEQRDIVRDKIVVGIERLSTLFRAGLWEDAKNYGLSPLQVQILLFIDSHDSSQCSITNIAKEFAVTKATVSDAVKVLLEKTLLKKHSVEDGRGFSLSLTSNGKKCIDKFSGISDIFAKSLDDVGDGDINKIWEGLLLLTGHLQKTNLIPVRMCFNCKNLDQNHSDGVRYYCNFMQKPLNIRDIMIDCPEHVVV